MLKSSQQRFPSFYKLKFEQTLHAPCIMAPCLIERSIHLTVYMVSAIVFHTLVTHYWK